MLFLCVLFSAFLASYVVPILDEALLNHAVEQCLVDNIWST